MRSSSVRGVQSSDYAYPCLNHTPDGSRQGEHGRAGATRGPGLYGWGESPNSKYFRDILSDFKPPDVPLTPAGAEMLRQHSQPGTVGPSLICLPDGVPHADLLPEPFKIVQTPTEILMLYEVETIFRQILTDGRKFPEDPRPTWRGIRSANGMETLW